jgi:metallo-beta-lactamase family protein
VYVDSPLALSATDLYRRHPELFDTEARALLQQGECIFDCPNLRFTRSAQESKQLNDMWGMAVIIAASGMCTGGRILHHLKHHLWRKGTHVVMVGYQAAGSLGRRLVEKAPRVRIMGEWIAVRAEIHTLGGFSAHAGRGELLDWASNVKSKPRVFLNHGEDRARTALAQGLRELFGWESTLPEYQSVHEI